MPNLQGRKWRGRNGHPHTAPRFFSLSHDEGVGEGWKGGVPSRFLQCRHADVVFHSPSLLAETSGRFHLNREIHKIHEPRPASIQACETNLKHGTRGWREAFHRGWFGSSAPMRLTEICSGHTRRNRSTRRRQVRILLRHRFNRLFVHPLSGGQERAGIFAAEQPA